MISDVDEIPDLRGCSSNVNFVNDAAENDCADIQRVECIASPSFFGYPTTM